MARLDYSAPGVYVEEVDRGSRPISGVPMSVGGFVGFTEDIRGDAELFSPMLVTSWTEYLEYFAKAGSDGFTNFDAYLPFAVKGWFDNGGGRCWVVSIGTQLPGHKGDESENSESTKNEQNLLTTVKTAGKKPTLNFKIKAGEEDRDTGRVKVLIEPDTPRPGDSDDEEDQPFDTGEFFKVTLKQGNDTLKYTPPGESEEKEAIYRHLSMDDKVDEKSGIYAETALADCPFLEVALPQDAAGGLALARRPANGIYEVSPPPQTYGVDKLHQKLYGVRQDRTGVQGLFEIDEVSMIACPDLMLAYQKGLLDLDQVHGILEVMVTNCENSAPSPAYRMAVLDMPPVKIRRDARQIITPDRQKPQDVKNWMDEWGRRSQFAALYYPWINVPNPRDNGKPLAVPPCGHMMGIWCQTDESRGVYKAPANITPRGVTKLAYDVNFREQELLNPMGVNCIRKMPDRGIRVWGARTLVEPDNVQWRYISVRRLMSYIEKSIEQGTQWAVFEPNDEDLWARVTRTVKNFLERLWREGALFGRTPEEAFYVKCDGELNTPETMMLGRLYIDVGVSPVRPAEFVVFRISQWSPNQ